MKGHPPGQKCLCIAGFRLNEIVVCCEQVMIWRAGGKAAGRNMVGGQKYSGMKIQEIQEEFVCGVSAAYPVDWMIPILDETPVNQSKRKEVEV